MSSNQFNPNMSLEEREKKLAEMPDEDIDFSDIPELDEAFFKNAKLVKRQPNTEAISIRVDTETLEWFRAPPPPPPPPPQLKNIQKSEAIKP